MKFQISKVEHQYEERGEDGMYVRSNFHAQATAEDGRRWNHYYHGTSNEIDALIRIMSMGITVDSEYWMPVAPAYGSEAYERGGGDYAFLMTRSERAAADGNHREAELEARLEDSR